jgi:voltage-gated potassium channel
MANPIRTLVWRHRWTGWLLARDPRPAAIVVILGASLLVGTVGFRATEGWSLLDALYMSAISVTTVGYGEVHPLSESGRAFAAVLVVVNMALTVYAATLLTSYVLEGHLGGAIRRRRLERRLARAHNHVIVCGYGRVGRSAARHLQLIRTDTIVIEDDPTAAEAARIDGFLVLERSATDEEALALAGIDCARGVIGALATDRDNITLALTARDLRADVPIICRATDDAAERLLRRAGATHVMTPYTIGGQRMATMLVRPHVLQFLDVTMHAGDTTFHLDSIEVRGDSRVAGKVLRETRCFAETDTMVVGVIGRDGRAVINPPRTLVIEPGITLIVLGSDDQISAVRAALGSAP